MFDVTNTTLDLENSDIDMAILPVGAIEQHGAHLPLGVDWMEADAIAKGVARKLGAYVLPAMPFGNSQAHVGFRGPVSLSFDTLAAVVTDIALSLLDQGFRRIVVINLHGGNIVLKIAVRELNAMQQTGKVILVNPASVAGEKLSVILDSFQDEKHAGEWETSAMMFVKPDLVKFDGIEGMVRVPLVDRSLIKGSVAQDNTETFAVQDVASWVNIPEPDEVHDWGVGTKEQIRSATAEKGKKVLTRAMERYLALIRDLEMHYAPDEVPGVDVRERPAKPRFKVDY